MSSHPVYDYLCFNAIGTLLHIVNNQPLLPQLCGDYDLPYSEPNKTLLLLGKGKAGRRQVQKTSTAAFNVKSINPRAAYRCQLHKTASFQVSHCQSMTPSQHLFNLFKYEEVGIRLDCFDFFVLCFAFDLLLYICVLKLFLELKQLSLFHVFKNDTIFWLFFMKGIKVAFSHL